MTGPYDDPGNGAGGGWWDPDVDAYVTGPAEPITGIDRAAFVSEWDAAGVQDGGRRVAAPLSAGVVPAGPVLLAAAGGAVAATVVGLLVLLLGGVLVALIVGGAVLVAAGTLVVAWVRGAR